MPRETNIRWGTNISNKLDNRHIKYSKYLQNRLNCYSLLVNVSTHDIFIYGNKYYLPTM